MALAIGLDVHRAQITFDALDEETGEVKTGRIAPADRSTLRNFLADFAGQEVRAALEATTGWRFVCEELERIGAEAHLAELADTRALRGSKRRAKTDRLDARHLRELLSDGAAGVVDPAGAHRRAAQSGAPAPHAGRRAQRRGSSASTRSSSIKAYPARAGSPASTRRSAWRSST